MALINCPECNNQVSSYAEACPKCGYPIGKDKTPADAAIREKAKSWSTSERLEVASDPSTPPYILEEMLEDNNSSEVREALAANPSLSPSAMESIMNCGTRSMLEALASNHGASSDVLDCLSRQFDIDAFGLDHYRDLRCNVASNPSTPLNVLMRLARDNDEYVQHRAVRNESMTLESVYELARDERYDVRRSAIEYRTIPVDLLSELAHDPDETVRNGVAARFSLTPASIYQELSHDPSPHVRKAVALADRTPAAALGRLADDDDDWVRRNVADNPNTPPDSLRKLARDSVRSVRMGVARNSSTPTDVVESLLEDEDSTVRDWANTNLRRRS